MYKKALVVVVIIASLLRFYRIDQLMLFVGDQGTDYLTSASIITDHKFPLMLHETSQKGVQIGPFFYYLQALALLLSDFNPVAPAIMTILFDIASIFLIFKLGSKLYNQKIGFYASVIYAFSPLMIISARTPIHVSVYPFFIFIFFLAILSRKYYLSAVLWLILIQIHLSAVLLLLIALAINFKEIKNIKFKKKHITIWILLITTVFLIANQTLISLFKISINKIVSFTTLKNLYITPISYFLEIYQKIFSLETILVAVLFTPFLILGFRKLVMHKNFSNTVLLIWVSIALFGLVIKNSSAEHYFLLIIPGIFLVIARGIEQYKIPGTLLLLLFVILNLYYLPKRDYYMKTQNNTSTYNYGVPLYQRMLIAKYINEKSANNKATIQVVGDYDIYKSTGKNYGYLLSWLNKMQEKNGEVIKYIIFEPTYFAGLYKENGKRVNFENAIVEEQKK